MNVQMRTVATACLVLLSLSSCTLMQYGRPSEGEVKLLRLQVPDSMQENLPYEAVISYESQGEAQFKRFCFKWLSEPLTGPSPSLYYHNQETASDASIGSGGMRWASEAPLTDTSARFCAEADAASQEEPGRLLLRLTTRGLKPTFNKLEVYGEYLRDGEVKQTNKVSARFAPEREE